MSDRFSVRHCEAKPPIVADSADAKPQTDQRKATHTAKRASGNGRLSGLSAKPAYRSDAARCPEATRRDRAAPRAAAPRVFVNGTRTPGEPRFSFDIQDNPFWQASEKDLK
ncbi:MULTISPECIES: hypothetical protein [Mycetohabitans]|uniref:Uncharacterized protein n=1 Tax=Mycetohabitans rhizoxinica TaxID=412963 RepID=A0ABZ2PRY4_9BURK|nr:hypothetical protein [Mycetohabitans sp. B2]MCF7697182.1 hypothetical protein [Mycetohabitans sp. B2]